MYFISHFDVECISVWCLFKQLVWILDTSNFLSFPVFSLSLCEILPSSIILLLQENDEYIKHHLEQYWRFWKTIGNRAGIVDPNCFVLYHAEPSLLWSTDKARDVQCLVYAAWHGKKIDWFGIAFITGSSLLLEDDRHSWHPYICRHLGANQADLEEACLQDLEHLLLGQVLPIIFSLLVRDRKVFIIYPLGSRLLCGILPYLFFIGVTITAAFLLHRT